jgi:uroporphyrinogen decarboxylase
MNKRECVIAAIHHEKPDTTPYHLRFTSLEREKLINHTNIQNPELHFGNFIDIVRCMDFPVETEPGLFRDEFGVVWDRHNGADIGLPRGLIFEEPDCSRYIFPPPVKEQIKKQMAVFKGQPWDTFRMVNAGFTLYERAWSMRGIENTLMDMILNEDFISELFDKIVDYNIAAMDMAISECNDFDALYFGDDWGQQRGLIIRVPMWEKFIGPQIAKLLEYAKKRGKFTVLHSCGDIEALFPHLIEAGLDVYDTFQPEIYDIKAVKKKYGSNLSFLGGISTQTLLPNAAPKQVEAITRETMEIMGESGGYIAAPTHDIPDDVPVENILAMIKAFQRG